MSSKKYLTVEQVSERFDVNTRTIYRMAKLGQLPAFKIGSQWRFCEELLESWVADQVTIEWLRAGDKIELRSKDLSKK